MRRNPLIPAFAIVCGTLRNRLWRCDRPSVKKNHGFPRYEQSSPHRPKRERPNPSAAGYSPANSMATPSRIALALVSILAIGFGVLAYCSVLTKSATFDEPIHFVGGHIAFFHGDYR